MNIRSEPDRKSSYPKDIGGIVQRVLDELGLTKKFYQARAKVLWDDSVGERISQMTSVLSMRGGTLFVAVKTAPWKQQLTLFKPDLIAKLNENVGRNVVEDIFFVNEDEKQ